jgi:hypothetical protein
MNWERFKGNSKSINELKKLTETSSEKGLYLLVGENGTGKSFIFQILHGLEKTEVLYVDETNYSEKIINNFVNHNTIENMFHPKQKIIFIDDLNLISSEKTLVSTLTHAKKRCLVICTIRVNEERKISALKSQFTQKLVLSLLSVEDCLSVVLTMAPYEEENIDLNKLRTIIINLKSNIPKVIMLVDSCLKTTSVITFDEIQDSFDPSITTYLSKFFGGKLSWNCVDEFARKDVHLITAMIHENFIKLDFKLDEKHEEQLLRIYDVFSSCDMVDKYIYTKCAWNTLQESNNLFRIASLNGNIEGKYCTDIKFDYTKQFTKLSSQSNMKRKLLYFSNCIKPEYTLSFMEYLETQGDKTNKCVTDILKKFEKIKV